jgi:hypothetical protein
VTMHEYEAAVIDALAEMMFLPPEKREAAQTALEMAEDRGYDLDDAHGDMLTPAEAAAQIIAS